MSIELTRPDQPAAADTAADEEALLRDQVIEALKSVYDPEIPVNIYDLGLIYELAITPDRDVRVQMTLTTPNCPVAESMPDQVMGAVEAVPGIRSCEVDLVWEPRWDTSRMSEMARMALDIY